jgi:3-dehydroquinate dehydratase I
MTSPAAMLGSIPLGRQPVLVGVVPTRAALESVCDGPVPECDAIEIRLDQDGLLDSEWAEAAACLTDYGIPIIVTIRDASEGGAWQGPDEQRLNHYRRAIPFAAALDVEIRSAILVDVIRAAAARGRLVIGSFHDFDRTPETERLEAVIARGIEAGVGVVKIATMMQSTDDVERVKSLLGASHGVPLCLLGMGVLGAETRVDYPLAGSVLTYGFIGQANAPGQLPCSLIREKLMAASPAYCEFVTRRKKQ